MERPNPYAWVFGLLVALGAGHLVHADRDGLRRSTWQCPAHVDDSPSLSLAEASDGRALIHCHAGCDTFTVMAALSCPVRYLSAVPQTTPEQYAAAFSRRRTFPPMRSHSGGETSNARHEAFHPYGDRWRMERRRTPSGSKTCTWETRDGAGAWIPGMRGATAATLPLYNERDIHGAVALEEPVLLVESESSVDALTARCWYATTWAGGASSPPMDTIRRVLGGYDQVVVIGDADAAGRGCVDRLHAAGVAPHVLFSDVDGEDARDLHHRVGPERFALLVDAALAVPTDMYLQIGPARFLELVDTANTRSP